MSAATRGVRGWLAGHAVLLFGLLVLLYMFTPIFVVVLMSFNDPVGRLGYDFAGFTLYNWQNITWETKTVQKPSWPARFALTNSASSDDPRTISGDAIGRKIIRFAVPRPRK